MPHSVIYARKSSESEDRQVLSIDSQIQELKLLALRRGLEVSEVLTESHSAKAPGRPVFGNLMHRIRRGEIDTVLCWKMDRLARNHFDTGQVLQALADSKLRQVLTPERPYTADGNDRFLGNFELGIATKFIDDLRSNVKRGNRARFQRGWPNFRPPIGYLDDHAAKTVVKDPERFPLVRKMWDLLLAEGLRPHQILRVANEEWGFLTRKTARQGGRPLRINMLFHLFHNPYYMGLIQLKSGETYRGGHEPMVTPAEFERAAAILRRPGRARPARHEFPYAGLLRCKECSGVLTGEEHVKPSGRRYVYYRCHGTQGNERCRATCLPEQTFEAEIHKTLSSIALPSEVVQWVADNLKHTLAAESEADTASRCSLEEAFRTAQREGEMLLTLRLRSQVDEETFEKRRLEILERQAKLKLQLDAPPTEPEEYLQRLNESFQFANACAAGFELGSGVQRREIVQAVTSNFSVDGKKPLYIANEPFSFMEGQGLISSWQAFADDLRTWLKNTPWFPLPKLDRVREDSSVPRTSKAA
jgi:DNA invertase Pin-like site-specific DNA recombinase